MKIELQFMGEVLILLQDDMSLWLKDNTWKYIEKQLSKIFIKRPESEYDLIWFENYQIIETKLVDISSTKVKESLLKNSNQVSDLIIPEIKDYILKNDLYK